MRKILFICALLLLFSCDENVTIADCPANVLLTINITTSAGIPDSCRITQYIYHKTKYMDKYDNFKVSDRIIQAGKSRNYNCKIFEGRGFHSFHFEHSGMIIKRIIYYAPCFIYDTLNIELN